MESLFGGGAKEQKPKAPPNPIPTTGSASIKSKSQKTILTNESAIVTKQPIRSEDQSNERINPADSTSVKIEDIKLETHEGKPEDTKANVESENAANVQHLHP